MTDQRWTIRSGSVPALFWPDDENPDMPFSFTEADLAEMLPDALDRQVSAAFAALADALRADCQAVTDGDGTSYCPMAERDGRDAARLRSLAATFDEYPNTRYTGAQVAAMLRDGGE